MKKYKIGLFGKYIDKKKYEKNFNHIFKNCKFYHLKERENYKKILHKKIDIIISYGYGVIFKKDFFLKNPKCKIYNMHIGYLPHGRGIYPNLISIIKKKKCGFSIHVIDKQKIDSGPLIYRKEIKFNKQDTMKTLFKKTKKDLDDYIKKNLKKILFTKKKKKFQRKYKYFSRNEAEKYFEKLPKGWNTRIEKINKIKFE